MLTDDWNLHAIAGVDIANLPQPAIADRIEPCAKTAWCQLERDHAGECIETERRPIPPSDTGPKWRPGWSKGR